MLSLSADYRNLLSESGSDLARSHRWLLPPLPLRPFVYSIIGRLSSMQTVRGWDPLLTNLKAMSVKTALKKCQAHVAPVGLGPPPPGSSTANSIDLDAVATAAENPRWVQEMDAHMRTLLRAKPDEASRYLIMEDLLHANSISRFHFIIKREPVAPLAFPDPFPDPHQGSVSSSSQNTREITSVSSSETPSASHLAPHSSHDDSSSSSASDQPRYRYWIQDLGSLNGVYIDGVRVRHRNWTLLREGVRLRFAPITRNAKAHIMEFQARDLARRVADRQAAVAAEVAGTGQMGESPLHPSALFASDSSLPSHSALHPALRPAMSLEPLTVKDLHIEYVFTHDISDECRQRVHTLDQPINRRNMEESAPTAAAAAAAAASAASAPIHSGADIVMVTAPASASAPAAARLPPQNAPLPIPAPALPSPSPPPAAAAAAAAAARDDSRDAADDQSASQRPRRKRTAHEAQMDGTGEDEKRTRPMSPSACATAPMPSEAPAAAAAATTAAPVKAAPELPTPVSTTAAAVPVPVSVTSASPSPPAASGRSAELSSMLEEFTCGICSDVVYQCVVLDCSHSYCKHCIDTWFRKKKACPLCREKHKGAPRAVRSADNVINMLVSSMFTEEEKRDRAARIASIDAENKEREARDAEKARLKQERLQARQAAAAAAPQVFGPNSASVLARAQERRRAIEAFLRGPQVPRDDDDDADAEYNPDEEDEDDGRAADDAAMDEGDDDVQVVGMRRARRRTSPVAVPPQPQPHFSYTLDLASDRRTACRICCSIIELGLLRLRQQAPAIVPPQPPAGQADVPPPPPAMPHPHHFHISCFVHDHSQPRLRLSELVGFDALPGEIRVLVESLVPHP